jgi:hypothetical protein
MRIQGFAPITLAALALLVALTTSGCTRRVRLTPQELYDLDRRVARYEERVKTDPNAKKQELFVYAHRRFIVEYQADVETAADVGRKFAIDIEAKRPLTFIRRHSAGQIIAREEHNGVPLLWVSFDECDIKDCAFGFVRTEDNLHKLVFVPALPDIEEREAFKLKAVYHRSESARRVMRRNKVKSLGEANEVYVLKRKRRVKTIHLDVRKRLRKKEYRTLDIKEGR